MCILHLIVSSQKVKLWKYFSSPDGITRAAASVREGIAYASAMHGKYKGTDLAKIIGESADIAEAQDVTHRLFVMSGVIETANNQVSLNVLKEVNIPSNY